MREQGVVLEHVSDTPLLRRKIDLLLRVEEHTAAQADPAFIRPLDPCDALQRQCLAAAGRPEQREQPLVSCQIRFQTECSDCLFDMNL